MLYLHYGDHKNRSVREDEQKDLGYIVGLQANVMQLQSKDRRKFILSYGVIHMLVTKRTNAFGGSLP